jgi:monofunctional biosynthetic peptidoglycan transglycosylase
LSLSEQSLHFESLGVSFELAPTADSVAVNNGNVDFNGVSIGFNMNLSITPKARFILDVTLPQTRAMDILRALPEAMKDVIEGMRFAGVFSFKGSLMFDLDTPTNTKLTLKPDCSNLHIVSVPKRMDVATLSRDFIQVISLDDEEIKRQIGPDSPDWTPLDDVPPYFVDCLLASEDITFFQHRGFCVSAIRSALVDDLVQGQVVRGASTISQQLAKNLFLSKSKSLSRKLQEAVLTWYLESVLTKQRILELYLNVIEWGPKIYGIRQASMHYFGKPPTDLDLAESAFLVAIIPSPVPWHDKLLEIKKVPQAIERKMKKILKILEVRHTIDADVVQEAMDEPLEFNQETIGNPTPRASSASPHRQR